MIALIPVAGYATRLYPLTEHTPKALLEIAGKPLMDHVVDKILELGVVKKIVVVSNHKFAAQFQTWAGKRKKSVPIPIVVLDDGTDSNENRLGAIGDAQFAIEHAAIDDDVLWVLGDNLFSFSITPAFEFFKTKQADVIACFDVKDFSEAQKMGIVTLNSQHRVTGFVEKPSNPPSTLCSIGIYLYTRATVKQIKHYLNTGHLPDKPGEFVSWLYREKPVYGYVYNQPTDEWFDIGTLETLESVRKKYAKKKQRI